MTAGAGQGWRLECTAQTVTEIYREALGIQYVVAPGHADLLLVTGPVTGKMAVLLWKT